jgi:hypothetical protein
MFSLLGSPRSVPQSPAIKDIHARVRGGDTDIVNPICCRGGVNGRIDRQRPSDIMWRLLASARNTRRRRAIDAARS